jgi:hypothetical protein
MILKLFIFICVTIFGLSFYPIDRTRGEITGDIKSPPEVKAILRAACYDCHSFETKYPFYSYVFPMSILIQNHIKEGREEVNFSLFESLTDSKKRSKFKSIVEDIETDEMPLFEYTLLHRGAVLSPEQKQILINWAKENAGEPEEDDN